MFGDSISPVVHGKRALVAHLAIALMALGCGCGGPEVEDPVASSETVPPVFQGVPPIKVVATTGQVAELVRRLGGQHVDVSTMMGPGIDPHSYKHPPSETRRLQNAQMVVHNGLHLEGRLGDTIRQLSATTNTFAVTDGLVASNDPRLITAPGFQGSFDPHVWHDARLWIVCAEYVAGRLKSFDPAHAADYDANLAALTAELNDVDVACHSAIAAIPPNERVLITAHDAFGYFGRAYGLEVHGLQGLSTTDEVDLGRMEKLIELIVTRKIKAVFVESAVAPRTIEALIEPCRARNCDVRMADEVLYADALGEPGSGAETYAGMMQHNAAAIAAALGPQP